MATQAFATIKTIGKGDSIQFDTSKLSAQMKANYEIMKVKCVKCHTLERTVVAINRGIAPITGLPFDRNAIKAYGIKMKRKPDSNMNAQEIKACVELMNCLLDEANR
jgi:hypothetical protein